MGRLARWASEFAPEPQSGEVDSGCRTRSEAAIRVRYRQQLRAKEIVRSLTCNQICFDVRGEARQVSGADRRRRNQR
jgi:hypothetical protein